jgi:hypothetical protein
MAHATPSPRSRQLRRFRDQLRHAPALPFADLLPDDVVAQALRDERVGFRDRLFSPLVTLWVFLSQVLDPDHSCAAAVARLLAWRQARSLPPCSADTSAYCQARLRLPEGVLARLTRQTGRAPQDQAPDPWRWRGRTVKLVDGTTVSMPDTAANQQEFPQSASQRPGLGFPLARLVVLFSLATATVLDAALGRYRGKQTGETALFHTLRHHLGPGDLLLADRYSSSYWEFALVRGRGADLVSRVHQRRRVDFRRGRRLGREDHVVAWPRPPRPGWMDEATYAGRPERMEVREVRVRVKHPGFRTRRLVVATTLTDGGEFPAAEVAVLYRVRWQAELDLRSLKQTLQMDVLRCKTPAMVRKEVWAHLLAYNLVRGLMARAALEAGALPVALSFTGALPAVNGFTGVMWGATATGLAELWRRLREVVAARRVVPRPDRYEPRRKKRRAKPYPLLTEPRAEAQARLEATGCG